jgi:hypothetical protein
LNPSYEHIAANDLFQLQFMTISTAAHFPETVTVVL